MKCKSSEKNISVQVQEVISIAENLLGNQILGIYMYGSAILGSLRPDSDIDILIITNHKLSPASRNNLTKELLTISKPVGYISTDKRPLELTIINNNDIVPWQTPLYCEYMYGEWLRTEIESGKIPQGFFDPDIVILLWQAKQYSVTLKGTTAKEIIPDIPFADVEKAIQYSLPTLIHNLKGDERNVLLTLSRMWFTLETGTMATKDIAAKWALPKIPKELSPLLKMAKDAYLGKIIDHWQGKEISINLLVEFMQRQLELLFNKN